MRQGFDQVPRNRVRALVVEEPPRSRGPGWGERVREGERARHGLGWSKSGVRRVGYPPPALLRTLGFLL